MKDFKWTNTDVIENLQRLKSEKVTVGDVLEFLKQQYNKTCALRTIYRHMTRERTANTYLNDEIIVTLQTKFSNEMLAVKEGSDYRVYKKHKDVFECIDCLNAKTRPTPVPTLKQVDGHYMLNKGMHVKECRLHPKNKLMARDIDRVVREEAEKNPLMRPQEAHEKGQQHALKMAKNSGQTGKEPDSIAVLFPSWHSVRNQYYRRRKMAASNVRNPFIPPKMYDDTYRAFVMENKERWLSLADEKNGIVMFASDDDYKAAAQCILLMADGTFDLCPIGFAQIFIIHGLFKGEWIAVITCLMENRLEASYNVVFQHLQAKWAQLKIKPVFEKFHCDYEKAEMGAAIKAFGLEKIRGCLFHYSKAILRNTNSLGFQQQYQQDKHFNRLIRMTMALPLLPKDQAASSWREHLKGALEKAGASTFCDYFEGQWLKKKANLWNFYRLRHRTTNVCESYNSFLKRRNGALRRPGCTLLYQFLQKLQYQQSVRIIQLENGEKPRPQNKLYAAINEKLEKLWAEFEESTANAMHEESILPDTLNFLSAASHLLARVEKKEQRKAMKKRAKRMLKVMERSMKEASRTVAYDQVSAPLFKAYFLEQEEPTEFLPIKPNGHCFYGSIALIVYGKENEQAKVRRELMAYLDKNRTQKWTNWICSIEDVDDYIRDHATTPSEIFAEQKHWGSTQQLILAARLYNRNFIVFQPDERMRFLKFSAAYENASFSLLRTPLAPGPTSIIRYQRSHFDVVSQTKKK